MADVRRLMTRLNPSTARLDGAGGGKPEYTSEDVAGALGLITHADENRRYVCDDLSREVFCAIWWPSGAKLNEEKLLKLIADRQMTHWVGLEKRLIAARLELHMVRDKDKLRSRTSFDMDIERRCEQKLAEAQRESWPNPSPMYETLRKACLRELSSPNHCRECGGRGELRGGELVITCRQCDGTGSQAISDRQRAQFLGRDPKTYRTEWKGLYEWTYELLRECEYKAIRALREVIA